MIINSVPVTDVIVINSVPVTAVVVIHSVPVTAVVAVQEELGDGDGVVGRVVVEDEGKGGAVKLVQHYVITCVAINIVKAQSGTVRASLRLRESNLTL